MLKMIRPTLFAVTFVLMNSLSTAFAHPGHASEAGFGSESGLMHYLAHPDHLVLALIVGTLSILGIVRYFKRSQTVRAR